MKYIGIGLLLTLPGLLLSAYGAHWDPFLPWHGPVNIGHNLGFLLGGGGLFPLLLGIPVGLAKLSTFLLPLNVKKNGPFSPPLVTVKPDRQTVLLGNGCSTPSNELESARQRSSDKEREIFLEFVPEIKECIADLSSIDERCSEQFWVAFLKTRRVSDIHAIKQAAITHVFGESALTHQSYLKAYVELKQSSPAVALRFVEIIRTLGSAADIGLVYQALAKSVDR